MRKVLVITYYWPPSGGPGVQRILKFCKYFPEFGWEPIVLTVNNGDYPNMFIYSNLNDSLVPYKEPYLYYKKLKEKVTVFKENKKDIYLYIHDKFGHNQEIKM